jgi:hypothetical protein
VVALVLLAGGVFKLRDPGPTRDMFETLTARRHPVLLMAVVVSAVVEITLGAATFLVGGRVLAGLAAAAFVAFAVVAWRLSHDASDASCGCFGRHSGRTTGVHVAVDAGLAALAVVAAVVDAPGFVDARAELPAAGMPFVAFAALGAWFAVIAMTVLPDALLAARRVPRAEAVRRFEITGAP